MARKNRKKNRGVNVHKSNPAQATETTPDIETVNEEVVEKEVKPERIIEEIVLKKPKAIPRISGTSKVWFRSNGLSRYFKVNEELEITSEQAQLFIDKGHGEVFKK